ncbi:uncharacterized protein DS421_12g352810 [Arachis hypogaea]|nr:uncharacterized protein DS421_12g352810 [Arachis hypogaea]
MLRQQMKEQEWQRKATADAAQELDMLWARSKAVVMDATNNCSSLQQKFLDLASEVLAMQLSISEVNQSIAIGEKSSDSPCQRDLNSVELVTPVELVMGNLLQLQKLAWAVTSRGKGRGRGPGRPPKRTSGL